MKLHRNAKTTPTCAPCSSTGFVVSTGRRPRRRPPRASVCGAPINGWRAIGSAGARRCRTGSSTPHRQPRRTTPAVDRAHSSRPGHARQTAWAIAVQLQVPRSTVARVLVRAGLNRLARLTPPPPVHRLRMAAARRAGASRCQTARPHCRRRPPHPWRSPAHASRASAGSMRTSRSMTTVAPPTSRCLPDQTGRHDGRLSRTARSRGLRAAASASRRVLTDNGGNYRSRRFQAAAARHRVRAQALAAVSARRPTARPSASSRP